MSLLLFNIVQVSRTFFQNLFSTLSIPLMDLTVLANTAGKPTFLYAALANIFQSCSTPVNSFSAQCRYAADCIASMFKILRPPFSVGLYITFLLIFSKALLLLYRFFQRNRKNIVFKCLSTVLGSPMLSIR